MEILNEHLAQASQYFLIAVYISPKGFSWLNTTVNKRNQFQKGKKNQKRIDKWTKNKTPKELA